MGHDLGSVSSSSSSARALLAPGFRFHPTDEELVSYYLKRKVSGKRFRSDAISEVDVYKCEPWDLPGKSKLKSRDLEWYFFTVLDKKYGNGSRTNRATERGYWKTTGKDRMVSHKLQTVGMKKTLVYHSGRAPRGQRTNWVMHEYRLLDEELAKAEVCQDAFVLCRIFQKSGSGPKNGEQYGAPFIEEEWECDDLFVVPDKEVSDEAAVDNDFYIDPKDLEQILDTSNIVEDIPNPLSCFRNNISHVQEPPVEESACALQKQPEGQFSSDFTGQNHMDVKPVNQEHSGESSNGVDDLDFLLNEPFFDAISNAPLDDMAFLETDDLLKPVEVDPYGSDMLDNCLNYFNADEDISQYLAFDSSNMVGSEQLAVADQGDPSLMLVNGEAKREIVESQQLLQGYDADYAFGSEQKPENVESASRDIGAQDSFIKKASHMLGGISAPPAFASEFPVKESALLRISSDSISSSLHLTAGMVQIQDSGLSGFETKWSHQEKNIDLGFILSFGLSSHNVGGNNFELSVRDLLGKAGSVMYLLFVWVIILSVTCKVGTCFYEGNTAP